MKGMKSSSKVVAALALSLLVFPGTGHFLVKRYGRGLSWGALFGLMTLAMLAIVGANLSKVMDGMMSPTGDVPIDVNQVFLLAVLGLGLFLVWALAGLDVLWLTRRLPPAEVEEIGVTPAPPIVPAAPPEHPHTL